MRLLRANQEGAVSIVVTVVILIVLTITTMGFAQLARREQRESLDRQLSSQAYYIAEAGVNDAERALRTGLLTTNKTTCDSLPAQGLGDPDIEHNFSNPPFGSQLGGNYTKSEYSCVLVNLTPGDLQYDDISPDSSVYANITGLNSSNTETAIASMQISWQSTTGNTFRSPPNDSGFTPLASWGSDTGVLRVGLTNVASGANSYARTTLINNTFTGFLYPRSGSQNTAGSIDFTSGDGTDGGVIVNGNCATNHDPAQFPRSCNVRITGLSSSRYFLRLTSIYRNANVTVRIFDSSGNQLRIGGSQAQIDSTGKAGDVLRRIQVRVPITSGSIFPEYAVESAESLCKRLEVAPGSLTINGADPACQPN